MLTDSEACALRLTKPLVTLLSTKAPASASVKALLGFRLLDTDPFAPIKLSFYAAKFYYLKTEPHHL